MLEKNVYSGFFLDECRDHPSQASLSRGVAQASAAFWVFWMNVGTIPAESHCRGVTQASAAFWVFLDECRDHPGRASLFHGVSQASVAS